MGKVLTAGLVDCWHSLPEGVGATGAPPECPATPLEPHVSCPICMGLWGLKEGLESVDSGRQGEGGSSIWLQGSHHHWVKSPQCVCFGVSHVLISNPSPMCIRIHKVYWFPRVNSDGIVLWFCHWNLEREKILSPCCSREGQVTSGSSASSQEPSILMHRSLLSLRGCVSRTQCMSGDTNPCLQFLLILQTKWNYKLGTGRVNNKNQQ